MTYEQVLVWLDAYRHIDNLREWGKRIDARMELTHEIRAAFSKEQA